jgi:hypothetical protein
LSSYFLSQLPRLFARLDEQFVPPLLKPIQQGPQHRPVAFVGAATPITLAPPRPIGCGSLGEGRGAIAAVWPPWHRSSYPVTRHGYNGGLVGTINSIGGTAAMAKPLPVASFTSLRNLPGVKGFDNPRQSSHPCRVFPANLTSGGTMSHHCPAFGTGELQEGGTTL